MNTCCLNGEVIVDIKEPDNNNNLYHESITGQRRDLITQQ